MITLWLARHGLTQWNVEKRYQGHSDISLNLIGQQQAAQLAQRLASEKLHVIISSDLLRAIETAEFIAISHDLTVVPDLDLREANFGIFEGLRYKDLVTQHQMMAEAWFADPEHPPDGGEALSQVAARLKSALGRVLEKHSGKRVLLVGHDGALRLLLCELLGLPAAQYWRFNLDPASLSQVNIYPGGAILVRLNDIGHLTLSQ